MATTRAPSRPAAPDARRGVPTAPLPYRLSAALAVVAALAGALTLLVPGLLGGPAAMRGSARGTALVVLVVAAPALLVGMRLATRGSARGLLVWLGATGYLLYNAVMFLFGTPYNRAFLLYVGMLSLALWTSVALLTATDVSRLAGRFSARLPARGLAVYVWAVAGLNTLVWLRRVVPTVAGSDAQSVLAGTGLTTVPTYVQDLAFWLPLMALAACWLWQRRPWGLLLAGGLLTMWVVESLGVAVDQLMGAAADPASPVVSAAAGVGFLVLAVASLGPAWLVLRDVDGSGAA